MESKIKSKREIAENHGDDVIDKATVWSDFFIVIPKAIIHKM